MIFHPGERKEPPRVQPLFGLLLTRITAYLPARRTCRTIPQAFLSIHPLPSPSRPLWSIWICFIQIYHDANSNRRRLFDVQKWILSVALRCSAASRLEHRLIAFSES